MKNLLCVFTVLLSLLVCAALAGAADGKELYAKCQGCHGADGAKTPMGVGKPLKGMAEADVYKAMVGYKAGTYGGEKKMMMEGQVKTLSDDDMKALAAYIAKL